MERTWIRSNPRWSLIVEFDQASSSFIDAGVNPFRNSNSLVYVDIEFVISAAAIRDEDSKIKFEKVE